MGNRFTDEQRAAIEAQGKTIVSASAGSGKTTVMIEKIIRLIKSGCSVEEVLAVTFTKKAAAQMKEKLSKELIEAINAEETSTEKRAELKKRLSEVPSADISTIHSFCAKLIRSHFFIAGVDNAFKVIGGDDAEGKALKNAALDEVLDEGYESKDEKFLRLLSVYWRKKSDNALRKIFMTAYETLRNRADYREYLQRSGNYDEKTFDCVCADLFTRLKDKCAYYLGLLEAERAYFEEIQALSQSKLSSELIECLQEICAAPGYFEACAVQKPKFTQNRSSKNDDEIKREHIEKLAFLKTKVVKIFEDELEKTLSYQEELERFLQSGETAAALAEYLIKFDDAYAKKKTERGVLDYNDLEHKALELLKNETIVCEMQEKYRYVFVDEYQDVNPVQEEIISRLSGENLFLVGDVKQSIYGFRGSKSKFFVEKQREFEETGGNNLAMTRNFRSADEVLNAVNTQFSLAMNLQTCNVDYSADSYMERGGRYALNSGKVRIHFLGKEEKTPIERRGVYSVKEKTAKRGQSESLAAKTIRAIIEEERKHKIFDADLGEYRMAQYSDIAILSRKKQGQIAETVAALSAEGIPVSAAAAVNVCAYAEVKTLIDILSLIDNAQQDVPLCSALLSSMGGFSADELTLIRLAYKEETFFRCACRKYAEEKSDMVAYKLRKFYEYFEKIRNLSRVLDTGELLTKLLSETRMEADFLSRENGVACMRRIHRFIEETAVPEPLCVHAFLERLRDLEYTVEYSENGGEDSVKALTMHSSKGLEYPIVILDNLSAPFRGVDHDEVFVEETYGLAPRAFDVVKMTKSSTLLRRLHEEKEASGAIADELNLYYVALTRAKHTLHMLFEKPSVMPNVRYAKSFAEFTDFKVWKQYVEREETPDLPKQERTAFVFKPDETLTREIMDSFLWQYPHTGCENLPVKSSATALMTDDGHTTGAEIKGFGQGSIKETLLTQGLFDDEASEKGSTSVELGLAYHAFLERFDFSLLFDENGEKASENVLKERILEVVTRMREENADEANLLDVEKLREILYNQVFFELAGMRLYKEQQFLVSLPIEKTYETYDKTAFCGDAQKEETLFQGAIDLLAVGEDEARIIDYKYSRKGEEELRAHYMPQLKLYRLAVSKILGLDEGKIRCVIVNIYRGFQVDM